MLAGDVIQKLSTIVKKVNEYVFVQMEEELHEKIGLAVAKFEMIEFRKHLRILRKK